MLVRPEGKLDEASFEPIRSLTAVVSHEVIEHPQSFVWLIQAPEEACSVEARVGEGRVFGQERVETAAQDMPAFVDRLSRHSTWRYVFEAIQRGHFRAHLFGGDLAYATPLVR
jgi:hypothetical protein